MRRTLALTAALVLTGALAVGAFADTKPTARIAAKKITAEGVGQVKLGMTFKEAREKRLIGKLRPGCEFGGPETRSARLRSPLRGTVNFTLTTPRKIDNILITRLGKVKITDLGLAKPMHDDLFEFGAGSELLVDMKSVIVAAQRGKGLDVLPADGLANARA